MKKAMTRMGVPVALAVGAFIVVSQLASIADESPNSDPDTPPAARVMPTAGLSPEVKDFMREKGVEVVTPDAAKVAAEISSEEAVKTAAGSLGFTNDGKASGVELARMTDPNLGEELRENPNAPSNVDPLIDDRLVWVVEFDGFTMPEFGPLPSPGEKAARGKPDGEAKMWVAVDATSGEMLIARQF